MGLFIAIGIGLLAGAIGGYLMHDEYDSFALNLVAGIVGSMGGLGLYFLTHFGADSFSYVEARVLICEVLGAIISVASFDALQKYTASKSRV